eukprot:m.70170 g.70170  ORF g.70170 m.70170 type:complete len:84 (+) comp35663_c0_seq1:831-1082(+)
MAIKFPSIVVLFRPLDAADFFRQAFGLRQSKKHLSSSGKSLKRRSSSKEGGKRKDVRHSFGEIWPRSSLYIGSVSVEVGPPTF